MIRARTSFTSATMVVAAALAAATATAADSKPAVAAATLGCKLIGAVQGALPSARAEIDTSGMYGGGAVFVLRASDGAVQVIGQLTPSGGPWVAGKTYEVGTTQGQVDVRKGTALSDPLWRAERGTNNGLSSFKLVIANLSDPKRPHGTFTGTLVPVPQSGATGNVMLECGF